MDRIVDSLDFLSEFFARYHDAVCGTNVRDELVQLRDFMAAARDKGRKTIIAGNGGSASIAAHCAVDFSKNAGVRCVNFSDSSLITCLANDYGFDRWLEKALEIYADEGDLVVLISSSGKSANMLNAADYAVGRGHNLVTLTGFDADNPLRSKGALNFWVESRAYNIVEMTHKVWLLAVCDLMIGKMEYPAS